MLSNSNKTANAVVKQVNPQLKSRDFALHSNKAVLVGHSYAPCNRRALTLFCRGGKYDSLDYKYCMWVHVKQFVTECD